jgi:hypothetical protein
MADNRGSMHMCARTHARTHTSLLKGNKNICSY